MSIETRQAATDLFDRPSTIDDGKRSDLDLYETPKWMTLSLLHFQPTIGGPGLVVLECCSGRDAITNVLRAAGSRVYTNDIDPRHPAEHHADATQASFWKTAPNADWVVTNPPFAVAFPILVHAFEHARIGVALLVRKTFLEPTEERGAWLAAHPPARIIGEPRHSFRGSGNDSVACDWMIWSTDVASRFHPPFIIDHIAKSRRTV